MLTPTIPAPRTSASALLALGKGLRNRGLLADLQLRDLVAVHLVGTVGEAQRARVRVGVGEAEIVADAAAAVHLHRPVDHLAGHGRRQHLDHRDLLLRDLVADRVHLPVSYTHLTLPTS